MTLLKHKRDFIDKVAYGIRTFITPIGIPIDLIAKSKLTPENKKRMFIVQKNIYYLNHLVNNVLDVAKLEGGTIFGSNKVDISTLINDVVTNYSKRCKEDGVTITVALDSKFEPIWIDTEKIKNVLFKILDNARKFIGDGEKKITISASMKMKRLRIFIHDTGIGIAKENLEKVFDNFYKTEGSGSESLGLDLAIARRIVETHGGKIWAESKGLGKGTTIVIELPMQNDLAAQNRDETILKKAL
jgi:signal transduction histidine kinase